MRGSFIVLEGPDGSGTTLHSRLLSERLRTEGHTVLLTAEPTKGPIGTSIRGFLQTPGGIPPSALQLLFCADRAWHIEKQIIPALERGEIVISDRYTASTIAYGQALGLEREWLEYVNKKFIQPDLLFFLLPPFEVCKARLCTRREHDALEASDLQEKVHTAYKDMAKRDASIRVVDTSGEKAAVAEEMWSIVQHALPVRIG